VGWLRLDLDGALSGYTLRGGPISSCSRSLFNFYNLLSSRLNCSEFIIQIS